MSASLRKEGYHVAVFHDLHGLLRLARSVVRGETPAPDLVILDRALPDGDGCYALSFMRALGLDIPVVLATTHPSPATVVLAHSLGAAEVLSKPFSLGQLRSLVGRLAPPA